MAAIVRASHALSFQLLNRDRQPILGIFDGQQGQTLKLDITNTSRRDLKPKALGTKASADNHHFELKFRPGTLNLAGKPQITVDADWDISAPLETDEGVSFYLLITKPVVVEKEKTTSVTLKYLSGDGKRGAHGTRVELKWKDGSLEYTASTGQSPEPLVAGHRLQHLSIVNESGQKHIPLHVGLVGNNKVLNDGKANELKMRFTNLLKPDPLKPGEGNIQLNKISPDTSLPPGSVFTISFDAGSQTDAWALSTLDAVQKINIKAVAIKRNGTKIPFVDPPAPQGQSTLWYLSPTESFALGPDEFVEVTISNIMTSLPSGQTNVYVHYKNIPGYWDGDFVSIIEKGPLVYKEKTVDGGKEQRVGIGTNDPTAKLHVAGKVAVDKDLSVGGKVTGDKLRVGQIGIGTDNPETQLHMSGGGDQQIMLQSTDDNGTKWSLQSSAGPSGGTSNGRFEIINRSPGVGANRFTILKDGQVGIGTVTPEKHLHVAGGGDQEIMIQSTDQNAVKWTLQSSAAVSDGRFEILNRSAGANRFTILKDGNVGIGTVTPGAYINEGNYFKADKEGRILEVHSPAHESVLILSSNQDRDGAHLGGIYFTRTGGQSDAHREVAAIKCKQFFDKGMAGGVLHFFTKPPGSAANFDQPRMVIAENGRVGIGTGTAPLSKAGLEVNSYVNTETNAYRYMNLHVTDNAHYKIKSDYSIWATKRVAAEEFNAVSDERIKTVRGLSNGAADLCTLLGIEITDYSFRDVIGKGNGSYKKVIGQQVEKVFPQAVSRNVDVVPDIYQQAPIVDGWISLKTDLKKGDRVKLVTEKSEDIHEVLEVTDDKFRVDLEDEVEKVFVFGREVDDLLTVDYDAIAMLNVSATQQLKKEMDQELKALHLENAELRLANDALARRLQLLESKVEAALGTVSSHNGSNGNGSH